MTDSKKILTILSMINFRLQENKDFLTDLDSAIGDGDRKSTRLNSSHGS